MTTRDRLRTRGRSKVSSDPGQFTRLHLGPPAPAGNPLDAPQLVPAVARVIGVTGRAPAVVVADRGFGTAANDQAMEAWA
jgi:hypothetical protein